MVDWLEWLNYVAESRRKVASSSLGFNPAATGYSFQIRKGLGSERRKMGSRFSSAVPTIQ